MLKIKRLNGMNRNKIIELANIDHEKGIRDPFQIGSCDIAGSNGTSIAIAIRAFASAPPKRSLSWNKRYTKPIMIGIKIKYNGFSKPIVRYCMSSRMQPAAPIISQFMFDARLVLISVYEA